LNGFCTITAYVVCGNFSISTYMDSIQLSPREGALWLWCLLGFISVSLLFLMAFPMLCMGFSIVYCKDTF